MSDTVQNKFRLWLDNIFGATADIGSNTGTFLARIRFIANAFSTPNLYTQYGTTNTATISATPAKLVGGVIYNRTNAIRFIQFFNRTTNPANGTVPLLSFPLSGNEKYTLQLPDFGSLDGINFSTGLAWAVSTTESTLTLGANTDASTTLFWRSI